MMRVFKALLILCMLLAVSACQEKETITPEKATCPVQIGVVTDINGLSDGSYNSLVWKSVKRYAIDNNLPNSCFKYYETSSEEEYVDALRKFADTSSVVIAASPALNDAVNTVSSEYRYVDFIVVDTELVKSNVTAINYNRDFLIFICGGIASYHAELQNEHQSVGFIGEDIREGAIFEQGAQMRFRTRQVEFSFNENKDFSAVCITYVDEYNPDSIYRQVYYDIKSNPNAIVLIKNIGDDLYHVLDSKAYKYNNGSLMNSQNVSASVALYSDYVYAAKRYMGMDSFAFVDIPTYLVPIEVPPMEENQDELLGDENANEELNQELSEEVNDEQ